MKKASLKCFLSFILLLLVACNVEIPKDIIQPAELETLLYDYHLVQAMSSDADGGEYQRRLYADFVFDKHNVSKEHFDSSMMWYTRNPKYLHTIYTKLYDKIDAELAVMSGEKHLTDAEINRLNGDTGDLWSDTKILLLSSSPYFGRKTFSYEADTTFVDGDSISFGAAVHFIAPDRKNNSSAHMALVVEYNDSTRASSGTTIEKDGYYAVDVPRYQTSGIKKISGHIYFMPEDSVNDERILVGNLSLMRIHPQTVVDE